MANTRIERLRAAMKEAGIPQFLVVDPKAVKYLTGIDIQPEERFYGVYVSPEKCVVLFNQLFTLPKGFKEEDLTVAYHSDTSAFPDYAAKHFNKEQILGVDKELKAGFLLPFMEQGAAAGYVNCSGLMDGLRGQKDAEEQEKMRLASAINDRALEKIKGLICEGITEKEVADQIPGIYKELGAEGLSFDPIVCFGANAADPHHMPDDTVIQEGDAVLFDLGCVKEGYCSDMTRTYFYKKVSEEHRKIYELVKAANGAAEEQVAPGKPIHVLDDTARNHIAAAGYGAAFNHRLGHFIGQTCHEAGDVSANNGAPLKPGMIFSIEPGIYLPGDVGVRIEDLVLVTETGAEILNRLSKELEILG